MIETAYRLHQRISKLSLELRKGNGRDDALLVDLAKRLKLPVEGFSAGLKKSGLSAEDYLRHVLALAQPFARMFSEIYRFLGDQKAVKADQSIRIRFGFPGDAKGLDVDWEQFRVLVERAEKTLALCPERVWSHELLRTIFWGQQFREVYDVLQSSLRSRNYVPYDRGSRILVPIVPVVDEADEHGALIAGALQSTADWVADNWPRLLEVEQNFGRWLDAAPDLVRSDLRLVREFAEVLHDAIPIWSDLLERWAELPEEPRRAAFEICKRDILPLIPERTRNRLVSVKTALDALDLPFWRHRWHTYEMWVSVVVLRALKKFEPTVIVTDGHIAFDTARPALAARLRSVPPTFVHAQPEMKLPEPGSRMIRPDLAISTTRTPSPETTAVIVEFKHRRALTVEHVIEVMNAYGRGTDPQGSVIMVNYDEVPKVPEEDMPTGVVLIGRMNPADTAAVSQFENALRSKISMIKPQRTRYAMFDVSASMADLYAGIDLQSSLSELKRKGVPVFSFSDTVRENVRFDSSGRVETDGSTQLKRAFLWLMACAYKNGPPRRVLLVSDGEFGDEAHVLKMIPEVNILPPSDVTEGIMWLLDDSDETDLPL